VAGRAFDQAVKLARHSVYRHPSLYANRAVLRARSKGAKHGLKLLDEMRREFGDDAEVGFYREMSSAHILEHDGKPEQAHEHLQQACRLHEELGLEASADMSLDLVRCCARLGERDSAREIMARVIRDNHDDRHLLAEVTQVMEGTGLESDPGSFIAATRREVVELNNRGVGLAQSGSLQEAADLFREAAEKMPANRVVNLNAARIAVMILQQQEEADAKLLEKARRYIDRVKRIDPESPELRKVQKRLLALVNGKASGGMR